MISWLMCLLLLERGLRSRGRILLIDDVGAQDGPGHRCRWQHLLQVRNTKTQKPFNFVCCWNHKSKASGIVGDGETSDSASAIAEHFVSGGSLANRTHIGLRSPGIGHRHKLHKLHFHVQNPDGSSPASPSRLISIIVKITAQCTSMMLVSGYRVRRRLPWLRVGGVEWRGVEVEREWSSRGPIQAPRAVQPFSHPSIGSIEAIACIETRDGRVMCVLMGEI